MAGVRATKFSLRLVEEHHRLFDAYAVTSETFNALLKDTAKN